MTTQTAVTQSRPAASYPVIKSASDGAAAPEFELDIRALLSRFSDDALDDWFLPFTADNAHLGCQFEIDGNGRLIAMASESRDGAERQFNLQYDLAVWTDSGPGGKVLIGNELVRLSPRGRRAADAGWIAPEQMELLPPPGQRHHALPFAPRFVVEIRSRSDSLESQQAKMAEWIANGVALGWLIDPIMRQVHIYRPGHTVEVLEDPETVGGGEVLPGFVFAVRERIFDLH